MKSCLIYVAGDVTNYELVDYIINDGNAGIKVKTFFAAHALHKVFSPEEVVALLPDSLIHDDNEDWESVKEAYKGLVTSRANELGMENQTGEALETFLDKLDVRLIPNVGVGSAKRSSGGKIVLDSNGTPQTVQYQRSRTPSFIFNVIYSVFEDLSCEKYLVDLTHGTNVLISAVLTAGSLFDSRFFSAPIMGRPGVQAEVEVVELTGLVEAMKNSMMISESIKNLDERYFRDFSGQLGRLNPKEFKDKGLIERVKKTDTNKVKDLLWNIRNGFSVKAVKSMADVRNHMDQIRGDVNTLRAYFLNWYDHQDLDKEELVLSNLSSTLKVGDLIQPGDDLTSMKRLLNLYVRASLYDKALSLARELPIAFCLKEQGGGKFADDDNNYDQCNNEVVEGYQKENSNVLRLRNVLMHGGLSKDLKVQVGPDGTVKADEVEKKQIEDVVNKVPEYVDEIIGLLSQKRTKDP
ncbi:uncharacterized protein predicted to be involved in DNA repair [Metallosphaera yellowstonensis MK1]|uniref:Uncharacterized protein predicted to be involved in DNA repair n=1 Tax=Metallosphaera yellowstonensis MK1 TaxID=671065 RepID=H2C180_9CREN|nr:TM1812 family CRISPR-associated protein [Metallosphaera yellowstonensis]EHP70001.1 uncharacterized protein predicted to be involved in DNA repair [Metallosphaera yellowstonensis MK1]